MATSKVNRLSKALFDIGQATNDEELAKLKYFATVVGAPIAKIENEDCDSVQKVHYILTEHFREEAPNLLLLAMLSKIGVRISALESLGSIEEAVKACQESDPFAKKFALGKLAIALGNKLKDQQFGSLKGMVKDRLNGLHPGKVKTSEHLFSILFRGDKLVSVLQLLVDSFQLMGLKDCVDLIREYEEEIKVIEERSKTAENSNGQSDSQHEATPPPPSSDDTATDSVAGKSYQESQKVDPSKDEVSVCIKPSLGQRPQGSSLVVGTGCRNGDSTRTSPGKVVSRDHGHVVPVSVDSTSPPKNGQNIPTHFNTAEQDATSFSPTDLHLTAAPLQETTIHDTTSKQSTMVPESPRATNPANLVSLPQMVDSDSPQNALSDTNPILLEDLSNVSSSIPSTSRIGDNGHMPPTPNDLHTTEHITGDERTTDFFVENDELPINDQELQLRARDDGQPTQSVDVSGQLRQSNRANGQPTVSTRANRQLTQSIEDGGQSTTSIEDNEAPTGDTDRLVTGEDTRATRGRYPPPLNRRDAINNQRDSQQSGSGSDERQFYDGNELTTVDLDRPNPPDAQDTPLPRPSFHLNDIFDEVKTKVKSIPHSCRCLITTGGCIVTPIILGIIALIVYFALKKHCHSHPVVYQPVETLGVAGDVVIVGHIDGNCVSSVTLTEVLHRNDYSHVNVIYFAPTSTLNTRHNTTKFPIRTYNQTDPSRSTGLVDYLYLLNGSVIKYHICLGSFSSQTSYRHMYIFDNRTNYLDFVNGGKPGDVFNAPLEISSDEKCYDINYTVTKDAYYFITGDTPGNIYYSYNYTLEVNYLSRYDYEYKCNVFVGHKCEITDRIPKDDVIVLAYVKIPAAADPFTTHIKMEYGDSSCVKNPCNPRHVVASLVLSILFFLVSVIAGVVVCVWRWKWCSCYCRHSGYQLL